MPRGHRAQGQRSPPQSVETSEPAPRPPILSDVIKRKLATAVKEEIAYLTSSYGTPIGVAADIVLSHMATTSPPDHPLPAVDVDASPYDTEFDSRVRLLCRAHGLVS